jgi:Asp-tRNA(Asn)/Glu-tRNA(Gln) amidotransferase A subunit family amidase
MRSQTESFLHGRELFRRALVVLSAVLVLSCGDEDNPRSPEPEVKPFALIDATIGDIHRAIQRKEITCEQLVRAYVARSAAYNGPCTRLVTTDGAPVAAAQGYLRAGTPIAFPAESVPASNMLPDLDRYTGPPLDLGRMEASASDPEVQQQVGLITGIPNAGQVNALESLNLRGERSVTCKGAYDTHPSQGALPAGAPEVCEAFRQQPDAVERAAELDAEYDNAPDLAKMPMYCIVFSVKNWYDAKDMRSTGGNDVDFAMDAPPVDSALVARLRDKGAIIFGKSIASQVGNTSNTGPAVVAKHFPPSTDNARATWGGAACTPYDTERSPGFSSGGAGASVAANLVTCGICETTGGSCRIPANPNNVASLVTTKGVISSSAGWTAQYVNHRPGVLCRTLGDAALVLDALKDPDKDYFDPDDVFTVLPKPVIPNAPYASFIAHDEALDEQPEFLEGMRIGVVREFMIKPNPNNIAISDKIDEQIKTVLAGQLKAELVESLDPLYPDDPAVANMRYTFQDAFSEVMPVTAPEYFFQTVGGELEFAVPGYDVTTKDYLVKLSLRQAPLSEKMNLRRLTSGGLDNSLKTPFLMDKYLLQRADARVSDWPSFVANATWFADPLRVGSENVAEVNSQDVRATQGIDRLKMVTVARLIVGKVMYENDIDVLVIPNIPAPVERNEYARDPVTEGVRPNGPSITDLLGVPEVIVPAGYNDIVYEAQYALSQDTKSYVQVAGTVESRLPTPLPVSMMFWAGPGDEPTVLRVASAYESATHHRVPPADFGALPGEPGYSERGGR